jgi:hypothetical protein
VLKVIGLLVEFAIVRLPALVNCSVGKCATEARSVLSPNDSMSGTEATKQSVAVIAEAI